MRKKGKIKNNKGKNNFINLNKLHEKGFITLIILIILIIALIPFYTVYGINIASRNKYANSVVQTAENYKNPVFVIDKIVTYSNAFAEDKSENQDMSALSLGQFSDIAIYINNYKKVSELNDENTVKKIYIDNININTSSNKGQRLLGYKDPNDFGKYKGIESANGKEIDYNILKTNKENRESAYTSPAFYQDCSNPLTLGYINRSIVDNYSFQNVNMVSLNGTILKNANVALADLTTNIKFKIHIVNNKDDEFVCNIDLTILSDEHGNDIFSGYSATQIVPEKGTYQFIKIK